METLTKPAIAFAERLDGGVVVAFVGGKCALFSAALLHEMIPFARDLTDLPADDLD